MNIIPAVQALADLHRVTSFKSDPRKSGYLNASLVARALAGSVDNGRPHKRRLDGRVSGSDVEDVVVHSA